MRCDKFSHLVDVKNVRLSVRLQLVERIAMPTGKFQRSPLGQLTNRKQHQNSPILTGNGSAVFGKPPGEELLSWVETVPNDGIIHFRGYFNQDNLLLTGAKSLADVLQKRCYDFEKPAKLRALLGRVQGDAYSYQSHLGLWKPSTQQKRPQQASTSRTTSVLLR